MDNNELKKRIDIISYDNIPNMDEFSVKMLTDNFKEPLVRRLVSRAPKNNQKWALDWIERKYRDCNRWNPTLPPYFQTLRFDIDCGISIMPDDDTSNAAPVSTSKENTTKAVSQTETKKKQTRIDELEKENAELKNIKQQLAEAQRTINEQAQTIQELKDEIEDLKEENDSSKLNEHLESELNRIKAIHEDTLVALLKPAFFNIEEDAKDFLRRIQGLDNQGVTDVAWQFLHDKKITPSKKGRFIWNILTAAKLYNATEQNWTAALRKAN